MSQLNTAISQMDQVTQRSAAIAEETASGSKELGSQAESVKDSVLVLQRLLGGSKSGPAPSAQPAHSPLKKGPGLAVNHHNGNGHIRRPSKASADDEIVTSTF